MSDTAETLEDRITEQTKTMLAKGVDLFQIFRLHDDLAEHVRRYIELTAFPSDGFVVDLGAGIGRMAKEIKRHRPECNFILVNNNRYQHEHVLYGCGVPWLANMTKTGLPSGLSEAVLFNYSLGYVPLADAFREAARLLRFGGHMILWDMEGQSELLHEDLGYQVHMLPDIEDVANAIGLECVSVTSPAGCSLRAFQAACPEYAHKFCARILPTVRPMLAKFTRIR